MAMEQLNLPTQICSMYEINLQCGDQILKSMIMQQDIILDLCFITGLYDHNVYDKRAAGTLVLVVIQFIINFK